MLERDTVLTKVRTALLHVIQDRDIEVQPGHHLVEDLGLDSVNIASLTIALEDEFDEVLLLNDWIASAGSPSELTVASLVDYVFDLLSETS